MNNYLEGANPFNLVGPPTWFLRQLEAMDPALVIFPSCEEGVYRVARRVTHTPGVLRALSYRPDTKVFVQHRLEPVTSLLPFARWGPVILQDLAERDIWRVGGADKAADILDARDEEADRRLDCEADDGSDQRAHAAYQATKLRAGQTVFLSPGEASRLSAQVPAA